jgi:hypothetical protein
MIEKEVFRQPGEKDENAGFCMINPKNNLFFVVLYLV